MPFIGNQPAKVPLTSADITDGIIVNADISSTAGITLNKISGNPSFRNIVINGDMQIAQRATSLASITGIGYYTLDRYIFAADSLGTWTMSQSTDTPTGQGFANSLKLDCTTADASPSASDFLLLQTRFEGQNLQYLKKGTANAVSLTLSFWVKSTKTGTFIAELNDNDNIRNISKSYTVNTTNTWEKKTITFEGDTTGVLDNNNGDSFRLNFWLGAGSSFTSGTLATTWGAEVTANRAVGQVNAGDSTSNDFLITGVQLEAGTSATDFEFLPIDVSFDRCERYYEKSYQLSVTPGTNTGASDGFIMNTGLTNITTTSEVGLYVSYKKRKRTAPTITLYDRAGNSGKISRVQANVAWTDNITPTINTSNDQIGIPIVSGSGSTATGMGAHYTADAEL